ncbi:regulatory protein (AmdA) [Colletotrichum truncatum]|uniref:Regulatory protein (AmdA) n=1 Tax=Colletotrichum truncatum TaxID=5467 RepID=A0ACC3YHB1_COLTU|nr:regulatory protein (AmdA) [Colletotrichum truncatum]KAF6792798.1 regulatory protein (AmdA) [Colletotrichum truncatum]
MPMPRGRPRRNVAPCRFCQKQFKRQEHLERHERTHTREQPFSCDCGRTFSRQDLLSRHQRLSHAGAHQEQESPDDANVDAVEATTADAPTTKTYTQNATAVEHQTTVVDETNLQNEQSLKLMLPEGDGDFQVPHPTTSFDASTEEHPFTNDLLLGMISLDFDFFWNDTQLLNPLLSDSLFDNNFPSTEGLTECHTTPTSGQSNHIRPTVDLNLGTWEPSSSSQQQMDSTAPEEHSAFASRMPSMEPEGTGSIPASLTAGPELVPVAGQTHSIRPWKISSSEHVQILHNVAACKDVLPSTFQLPSKHTLSRFLEGYFRGFHIHMPFLHCVTFSASSASPELLLSLAAVGALYRFERIKAYRLYEAAQCLITWRLGENRRAVLSRLTNESASHSSYSRSPNVPSDVPDVSLSSGLGAGAPVERNGTKLQTLQAMIVIMAMASWGARDLLSDALSMSSQVAMFAREVGIAQPERGSTRDMCWEEWTGREERRRTLFCAYVLLNLQSVAFDVPPLLLNREIAIDLPGCASAWKATNSTEWSLLLDRYMPPDPFQKRLHDILSGRRTHVESPLSSFGNYVLVHGLLQQTLLTNHAREGPTNENTPFSDDHVGRMEAALRVWQESWEATYESTTDPSSPKGPMGFNSTAILRLVYIRLNVNLGPNRHVLSRDPHGILKAFKQPIITSEKRSLCLDRAVLQCIHALSIPVRIGITFVSRTQTLNWSIQHALCNLECAFVLGQWLLAVSESVEASGLGSLRGDERRLVNMAASLVRETEYGDILDDEPSHAAQIRNLAAATMRLWAQILKGTHAFDVVDVVGTGLSMVADELERQTFGAAGSLQGPTH